MKLKDLISKLPFVTAAEGALETEINAIETDSRKVSPGNLFICIEGFQTDGHLYAEEAEKRGAAAIIAEKEVKTEVPAVYVNDSVRALAITANTFYGYPSSKLPLTGITGTNGKTTVSYLLDAIYQKAGKKTAVIGTIHNKLGSQYLEPVNTTPDALTLQKLFQDMRAMGVEEAIMEVSSHALELGRVYGSEFDTVIFTNLSQDHLDFHENEANYFRAKSLLFSQLGNSYRNKNKFAVLNLDDPYSKLLKRMTAQPVVTYAVEEDADVTAKNIELFPNRSIFQLKTPVGTVKITSRLTGRFNVYNMLAAAAAALANRIPLALIEETFKEINPIPGRFEVVDTGQSFGVIVDYAHTPEAVRNILSACRGLTPNKVHCVLGCGGDRDRSKRPLMALEALKHADFAYFTSDNPRGEDPEAIVRDMTGPLSLDLTNYEVILDRKRAIERAIEAASEGDIVVIAGKGHETYQEINGKRYPFDDRMVAEHALRLVREEETRE